MIAGIWQAAPEVAGVVIGGGGLVSLLAAWRIRKATAQLAEANAISVMQKVYRQFVSDTAAEIGALKEEIKRLRDVVESYQITCNGCPHNKFKRKDGSNNA